MRGALWVGLLTAACRGGGSTDGSPGTAIPTGTDPAAEEACDDFLAQLCATATRCDSSLMVQQCEADVRDQGLRCECAKDHDEQGLGQCLDELDAIDCDTFAEDDVPASCDGLFSLSCG